MTRQIMLLTSEMTGRCYVARETTPPRDGCAGKAQRLGDVTEYVDAIVAKRLAAKDAEIERLRKVVSHVMGASCLHCALGEPRYCKIAQALLVAPAATEEP